MNGLKKGSTVYYFNGNKVVECTIVSTSISIHRHKEGNYGALVHLSPKDENEDWESYIDIDISQVFDKPNFCH